MSLESNVGRTLQFETARPADSSADQATSSLGVTCGVCGQSIVDEYYDVNGQSACDRCRQQLAHDIETPKGFGVLGKAGLYGLGAAILGAILYYLVIAITNFEIGIVAIAIGYIVGYAVRTGTGNRGGRRFQVLAIVLTYWAVGLAYVPLAFKAINQQDTATATAPAAADPAPAEPASDTPPSAAQFMMATGILAAMPLALPVLITLGSLPGGLISAAIIAFGMQQAWRMTGVPQLAISGPYRVAPPAPST